MSLLISGNFQSSDDAEQAVRNLKASGFASDQTTTLVVGNSDSDQSTPVDHDGATAAGGAAKGATMGAAAGATVGVITAPLLGPAAAVAALGIGAYAGSLYGTLSRLGSEDIPDQADDEAPSGSDDTVRASGMWVAVSTPTAEAQQRAIGILRNAGATDIERAEGSISNGRWTDFDPESRLRPVAMTAPEAGHRPTSQG